MQSKNTLVTSWDIHAVHRFNRVFLHDNARAIMKQHKLTAAQVNYLGKIVGGFPYANERIENALIRRGISEIAADGAYERTAYGKQLIAELFTIVDMHSVIEVENWPIRTTPEGD